MSERCSSLFFSAMLQLQDQAVEAFHLWAKPLGMLAQDISASLSVLLWLLGLHHSEQSTATRAMIVLDHNTAISVTDALIHAGFQCRGFSGSIERIYGGVNLEQVQPFERKYLDLLINNALGFKHQEEATCWSCHRAGALLVCSRCRSASYCAVVCQRRDWPQHKGICKRTKAAAEARATAQN